MKTDLTGFEKEIKVLSEIKEKEKQPIINNALGVFLFVTLGHLISEPFILFIAPVVYGMAHVAQIESKHIKEYREIYKKYNVPDDLQYY